jgi:hypothetical protein
MKLIAAFALAGCVIRNDITHVVLRDVSKIAIDAAGTTIMPIGSASGEVPAFAYLAAPLYGSYVERYVAGSSDPALPEPPGAIAAWCPLCAGVQRRVVVDVPTLELAGTPDSVLRVEGDTVHIPWIFDERLRGHRQWHSVPRIALDVVTPRDNIASIDYERHVDKRGATGLIGPAGFMLLGGAAFGYGVYEHQTAVAVAGGALLALGVALAVTVLRENYAHDKHEAIVP